MLDCKDRRLTQKSKVCERHFEEQDIVKYFKHVVKGQEVLIPRGNWKLMPGALPRLFPGLPEHISKPGKTKCTRKSPKKRNEIGLKASAESAFCSSGSCGEASLSLGDSLGAVGITPQPSTSATNSSGVCLNELVTVPLPSRDWKLELIVDECSGQTCGVFFDRRLAAGELKVSKAVIVKNDGSCVVNGYNKMHKELHKTVDSTASVELNETDSLKICSGIQVAHTGVTGKLENVRHKLCSVLTTRPPIAAFATKGAAPGKILAELVLEAVVRLHKHNATVISIVSDGAGNNRSMWQQLGVSGSLAPPCHKIAHPCLPDWKFVHFICDVPHAIKCVRNHLLKHKYGQAGENRIDFSHYQLLYETEKKHLKVAHKLTEAHVQPTNFQKMNVRLAVQVSNTFEPWFIRLFFRLNCLGGIIFLELIHFNDVAFCISLNFSRVIKDFLVMLDTTEFNHNMKNTLLFASRQITESLRVSLLSIIDIIDELHKAGVPYVLTAKLNQDPLERFFGIVRSFHGDDDHPTIIQFSQIYRLLSLFTPVRNAVKGNCSGPAEGVLVSIHESLAEKAKAAAELKLAVEAKLDKKLLGMVCTEDVCCDERDHGYQKAGAHEMVVYYLAGYVHKKITKTITCEECCALLSASPDQFNSEETQLNQRRLTELRSFKPGCLREASFRLYALIKEVEEVVHDALETSAVFGDIFWMVLDRLHATALPAIGCNEHHEFLTAKIIKCYCLMCMHFFSRKKNRELLVTEKVQNARKKVKLL
ncbi:hypothetical protein HPB51_019566 [Rhipicephalus microplus]|uniref:Transposable element n=1 Tax=Rhipicephalus microplus TaxID=6941 RepID=A0A9J6DVY8_RHIMP|nr:hypothetical protein HPB51_019566 [Rhipicephalus microplus]